MRKWAEACWALTSHMSLLTRFPHKWRKIKKSSFQCVKCMLRDTCDHWQIQTPRTQGMSLLFFCLFILTRNLHFIYQTIEAMNNTQSRTLVSRVQEQVKTNEREENRPGLQNHVPLCAKEKSHYTPHPQNLYTPFIALCFSMHTPRIV